MQSFKSVSRAPWRALPIAMALFALAAGAHDASASKFKVLHAFCAQAGCRDGNDSRSGLVRDGAGNLYGTTWMGGAHNSGAVFKLALDAGAYKYKVLHSFCAKTGCPDGSFPNAALIVDTQGALYGTTYDGGGETNAGVAFALDPDSGHTKYTFKLLYTFCSLSGCSDGGYPAAALTYRGAQNGTPYDGTAPLFGTASGATSTPGAVFQLSYVAGKTKRREKILHDFNGGDGEYPLELVPDASGNLFGVANGGGSYQGGTVFELSPSGKAYTATVLHEFCSRAECDDGYGPGGKLAFDSQGRLVGTTLLAGGTGFVGGPGNIYRIAPNGTASTENVIYRFCKETDCTRGQQPGSGVIVDPHGNQFGTTDGGGTGAFCPTANTCGVIFERTSNGAYKVLYNFCSLANCADGGGPNALIFDARGNIYGTTQFGGAARNRGTVFKFVP